MHYANHNEYPKRGEIYYIDAYVSVGRAISPKNGRPAIIISNNERNKNSGTVLVVYLSHSENANSYDVVLSNYSYGKVNHSKVICGQIHTVDKNLIGDYVAECTFDDLLEIEASIMQEVSIDIANHSEGIECLEVPNKSGVNSEDSLYKRMYFELIDHLKGEKFNDR